MNCTWKCPERYTHHNSLPSPIKTLFTFIIVHIIVYNREYQPVLFDAILWSYKIPWRQTCMADGFRRRRKFSFMNVCVYSFIDRTVHVKWSHTNRLWSFLRMITLDEKSLNSGVDLNQSHYYRKQWPRHILYDQYNPHHTSILHVSIVNMPTLLYKRTTISKWCSSHKLSFVTLTSFLGDWI